MDGVVVTQSLSQYPADKIGNVMKPQVSNENYTYDEMPSPNIGELSIAQRETEKEFNGKGYIIVFKKGEVYEWWSSYGSGEDYDALLQMAQKAVKKID